MNFQGLVLINWYLQLFTSFHTMMNVTNGTANPLSCAFGKLTRNKTHINQNDIIRNSLFYKRSDEIYRYRENSGGIVFSSNLPEGLQIS